MKTRDNSSSKQRRQVLQMGTAGTIAAYWSKPIVDTIVLPAHAQTSIFGPFGEDFSLNVTGQTFTSFLFPNPSETRIMIQAQGVLTGDIAFTTGINSGSGGETFFIQMVEGVGNGFIDYAFIQNGVTTGTFRITVVNTA